MTRRIALTFSLFLMASTALAVSPVRAQSNDGLNRAIAAGVGLFILGKVISDQNARKKKATVSTKSAVSRYNGSAAAIAAEDERILAEQWREFSRGKPGRWGTSSHKVLPRKCFFVAGQGRNRVGVFGQSCLNKHIKKPNWLPAECKITAPIRHGKTATVYSARCLREFGYTSDLREVRDRPGKRHK